MTDTDTTLIERNHCIDYIEFKANRARTHDVKVALLVIASDLRAAFHVPRETADESGGR